MRIPMPILVVMVAALLVSPASPHEGAASLTMEQTDDSIKKVKELKKERIAVLREMSDLLAKLFVAGRVPYGELGEGRRLLTEAEVEAANTDAERVELYKKLVAALKQDESLAETRYKAGRDTHATILKARAHRLGAEIHLEQLKTKAAKAGK
ncbi:MAG TPA: hypothetical protein VN641_16170 [Urbifossiella sp.]|nr:hypothetical protein [Urbifossiella sp.]